MSRRGQLLHFYSDIMHSVRIPSHLVEKQQDELDHSSVKMK
jgi:hypothetical protein